jgi:hypothetical protein
MNCLGKFPGHAASYEKREDLMRTPFRLRHRLARFLLASAGTIAASPSPVDAATVSGDDLAATDDCDDDDDVAVQEALGSLVERAGEREAPGRLGSLLADMNAFDATRTASLAALAPQTAVRRALARALASPFRLVGDDFVLDQLAADRDATVREAAARATAVRRR